MAIATTGHSSFGPYEILAPLGRGGMGEVYRAWDPRLQREVALKIIRERSETDPEHLRRFVAEARAASALNHPNIITVFDAAVDGATPYIVGGAFFEPANRVHRGKNLTTGEGGDRADLPRSGCDRHFSVPQLCGAPIVVDECANNGWMSFNHPRTFVSQGGLYAVRDYGEMRTTGFMGSWVQMNRMNP